MSSTWLSTDVDIDFRVTECGFYGAGTVDNRELTRCARQARQVLSESSPHVPTDVGHRRSPAGHLLWRSSRTVQFEIGQHRVVVDGVSETAVRALLDAATPPSPELINLRRELSDRGYLWPADEHFAPARTPRRRA